MICDFGAKMSSSSYCSDVISPRVNRKFCFVSKIFFFFTSTLLMYLIVIFWFTNSLAFSPRFEISERSKPSWLSYFFIIMTPKYSNTHRDGSKAVLSDRIIEETDRQTRARKKVHRSSVLPKRILISG